MDTNAFRRLKRCDHHTIPAATGPAHYPQHLQRLHALPYTGQDSLAPYPPHSWIPSLRLRQHALVRRLQPPPSTLGRRTQSTPLHGKCLVSRTAADLSSGRLQYDYAPAEEHADPTVNVHRELD